ncbi:MAG TPA: xanthine dehydrogenase family protein molybdopterin-binding subunit [Vicinamibacterales bacterium]|nr:xanthine dehydrogenase family protein molybdopterin-binding subunit [Vicinamibacterales bacterium]
MSERIDAMRVVQDPAYAASLSDDDWQILALDPTWDELVGEFQELVAPVIARYGTKLGIPEPQPTPPTPRATGGRESFSVVGKRVPRLHGLGVVTNLGQYTQNMRMPGMLHSRTLRSPHPHARVKRIDTSKAEALSGVAAVLHRGNLPAEYRDVKLGSGPPDRFLFSEEVFEVGAPIAVVAAESEHIADHAVRLIEVEYEVLPAVFDAMEGSRPAALKQWDNKQDGTIINVTPPLVRGNPDQARADTTIEAVLTRATEQHNALELTNSLMYWDQDRLVAHYTNQHAHGSRGGLSQALKLPANRVRVVQNGYMGSGYGYRSGIDLTEVHTAILARITGRPVKTMYTREEDFVTRTHRPSFRNEMKLGVNRDGTIQFGHFRVFANVGAHRAGAANGAWFAFVNLYNIPNLKLEAIDVFTNSYKSGPYRCVSHPNGTFALEMMIEKAAHAIGMDPVEFRLKNINEQGNPDTKKPFSNPGIRDCITTAAERIGWKENRHAPRAKQVRPGVFHGIGLAAHACSHGAGTNPATGQVIVNTDGSVQCVSGSTEIGCGQRTQMAMIAAEALGVPLDQVSIATYVDTDNTTDTGSTSGSRQTNTGGRGMYEAAMDARRQILEFAAQRFAADAKQKNETLQVSPEQLDIKNGEVLIKANPSRKLPLRAVAQAAGLPILGRAIYRQDNDWERTAWAAHAVEVEVDTGTGTVVVKKLVAAHDVGRAINPFAVEQQVRGGVVMALGAVFTEELLQDAATGLPLNPNMLDYRPLSIEDAPGQIEVAIIERPKEYGVFGAHGIGEPPMAPPAAAVAAAVHNAVGIWLEHMPVTREKVLTALRNVR